MHNVVPRARYPACLLLPALNDARTGFWEAHKFAIAIRSNGAGVEGGAAAEKEEDAQIAAYIRAKEARESAAACRRAHPLRCALKRCGRAS